jgi:hypothetical protein
MAEDKPDLTWIDRYDELSGTPHLDGQYQQQSQGRLTDATSAIDDESQFKSVIASNRLLATLVTGEKNMVKLIHNLQVIGSESFLPEEEKIVGICWRLTSNPTIRRPFDRISSAVRITTILLLLIGPRCDAQESGCFVFVAVGVALYKQHYSKACCNSVMYVLCNRDTIKLSMI